MSLILNIDTAQEIAFVSLAENGETIGFEQNENQKDHGAFLHLAMKKLMTASEKNFSDLDAVAVTKGPGSYTGLRVGMASAKGICYALQKPLLAICTLKMMAQSTTALATEENAIICPMIDARRMEVFTALYQNSLNEIVAPMPLILNKDSFAAYLNEGKVIFLGSGAPKFNDLIGHEHAIFLPTSSYVQALADLSYKAYQSSDFADLAKVTPSYLKEYMI
jgi:tRNA threonylcarbamoyladenosine biosynthesis protein TsaB